MSKYTRLHISHRQPQDFLNQVIFNDRQWRRARIRTGEGAREREAREKGAIEEEVRGRTAREKRPSEEERAIRRSGSDR